MNFVLNETKYNSQNYTPEGKVPSVYGMPRKITGVTVHHWGVDGQTIDGISTFLCRPGGNTSAHFSLQEGLVYCLVAPKDAAWHAGSAEGNATTIGIECRPEMTQGDLTTLVELIQWLENVYGKLKIYPHKHWYATECPGRYTDKISWIADQVNKNNHQNEGDWFSMATKQELEAVVDSMIRKNKGFFEDIVWQVVGRNLTKYLHDLARDAAVEALHQEFDKQGTIQGKPVTGKTSVANEAAWAEANFNAVGTPAR